MGSERDLFANFERMRRDIDELFGDAFERTGLSPGSGFSPSVDVYYTGDPPAAVVQVAIAGLDIADIGLEIRGRQLLIAGERRGQQAEGRLYQQVEIAHGRFRRVVELGADVIAERAGATYEDGMLCVTIPLRVDDDPVRRVPIKKTLER